MIFRKTWLNISDNTTVKWLQTFHLYKGFKRKSTKIGFFQKGSARVVSPPRIEYKGFKLKFNTKGDICRSLVLRGKFPSKRYDGSVIFFQYNNGVLIKKQQNIKSKYLLGPIEKVLKRKKIKTLFSQIV
jgi:large subunit ribosomal protein L14